MQAVLARRHERVQRVQKPRTRGRRGGAMRSRGLQKRRRAARATRERAARATMCTQCPRVRAPCRRHPRRGASGAGIGPSDLPFACLGLEPCLVPLLPSTLLPSLFRYSLFR